MSIEKLKSQYDLDKDGKVTEEEINLVTDMRESVNADERADAQRKMTWYALIGMLIYPILVIAASVFGLGPAAQILGDMAATYFVSVAGIVAAFFGAEAYKNK